ncbi:MAG: ribonuclease P protein component [Saprospiraceae bacterium]|jgi:ribonuclease P protein component
MSKRFSLGKYERIKSRAEMTHVFESGESVFSHPFKLIYTPINRADNLLNNLKFGVTVPKRIHNKAVTRNKIKRLVRETYRLSKPELAASIGSEDQAYALMYIYVSKDLPELVSLRNQVDKLHRKWLKKILS